MNWSGKLSEFSGENKIRASVRLAREGAQGLRLIYELEGQLDGVTLAPSGSYDRLDFRDELWQSTCFECFFFETADPAYYELNVAPDGYYDAMFFKNYRAVSKRSPKDFFEILHLEVARSGDKYSVGVDIVGHITGNFALSPTLILDRKSPGQVAENPLFFALAHGEKPDFHRQSTIAHAAPRFQL